MTVDDLVRPIGIAPVNGGPKSSMPREQLIPGRLEGRRLELAAKPANELLDVMSRLAIGERVKEHSFLHRRERIQILDTSAVYEGPINRPEIEPRWRSSNGAIANAEFALESR